METVTITPNLKLRRVFYGITGTAGLLLAGIIGYEFLAGKTPDLWYVYLPLAVWLVINDLGKAVGYNKLSTPHISLDKHTLSVSGKMGGEIDLNKLSWIRLKNSRIEFEFQATGYKSYLGIPWNFRMKSRLNSLNKALQERCRHQGIEFESEF